MTFIVSRQELLTVAAHTKHGPEGRGGPGPCQDGCAKCWAEKKLDVKPPVLRETLEQVLNDNAARCLDDPEDSEVVLKAITEALEKTGT